MDNGSDKDHSRGLSCMFPFYLSAESAVLYKEVAASQSFLTYYDEAGYFAETKKTGDETETE